MSARSLINEIYNLIEGELKKYKRDFKKFLVIFKINDFIYQKLRSLLDNEKVKKYPINFISISNFNAKIIPGSYQILCTNDKQLLKIIRNFYPTLCIIEIESEKMKSILIDGLKLDKNISEFILNIKDLNIVDKIFKDLLTFNSFPYDSNNLILSVSALFYSESLMSFFRDLAKSQFFTRKPLIGTYLLMFFSVGRTNEYYNFLLTLPLLNKLRQKTKELVLYVIKKRKFEYFIGFCLYSLLCYFSGELRENNYRKNLQNILINNQNIFNTEFRLDMVFNLNYYEIRDLVKVSYFLFFDVRNFFEEIDYLMKIKEKMKKLNIFINNKSQNPIVPIFKTNYSIILENFFKEKDFIDFSLPNQKMNNNIKNLNNKIKDFFELISKYNNNLIANTKYHSFFQTYNLYKELIKDIQDFDYKIYNVANFSLDNFKKSLDKYFEDFTFKVLEDFHSDFIKKKFQKNQNFNKINNEINKKQVIFVLIDCFRFDLFLKILNYLKTKENFIILDGPDLNIVDLPTNTENAKKKIKIKKNDYFTINNCENIQYDKMIEKFRQNEKLILYYREIDDKVHSEKNIFLNSTIYLVNFENKLIHFFKELKKISWRIHEHLKCNPTIIISSDHGFIEVEKGLFIQSKIEDGTSNLKYRNINLDNYDLSKRNSKNCFQDKNQAYIWTRNYFKMKNQERPPFLSHGGLSPFENSVPYIKYKYEFDSKPKDSRDNIKFISYYPKNVSLKKNHMIKLKFKNINGDRIYKNFSMKIMNDVFVLFREFKNLIDYNEEFEINFPFLSMDFEKKIELKLIYSYENVNNKSFSINDSPIDIILYVKNNE